MAETLQEGIPCHLNRLFMRLSSTLPLLSADSSLKADGVAAIVACLRALPPIPTP
jgi:hypothetical protein